MTSPPQGLKGRGAADNPANRFEAVCLERDEGWDPAEDPAPQTQFFKDVSASILASNQSPDLGFNTSLNPYRGCEHGCAYCYARPTHEYLGFSAGLDFETRIMVKEDAPRLLRAELSSPRWQPQVIALSGVTDCYQPVERRLGITRQCLEVLAEFRNPVGIVTKNHRVTRDVDVLGDLARHQAVAVYLSITTLDPDLAARLEPRTSLPRHRLDAVSRLTQAGIPVGVMTAPVIPGLNDHELPTILQAAADAGARYASYVVLRLSHGLREMFESWLDREAPLRKEKVLSALRELRGGALNETRFGSRMRGEGPGARRLAQWFEVSRRRAGMEARHPKLSVEHFRVPATPDAPQQEEFGF